MFCKFLPLAVVLLFPLQAIAADYPEPLRGTYGYPGGDCKSAALTVARTQRVTDVDTVCVAKGAINPAGAKFFAEERCGREGRKWTQKTVFELNNGMLTVTGGNENLQLKQCTAAGPAARPATAASGTTMCKVQPGQAGVTTYLDGNLKRAGSSVRDFDEYRFKATGRTVVRKTDVLVGQLIRSDGSVAEPISYAMAEEWECR